MIRVYHNESCRGAVSVDYFIDGTTVRAHYIDGDIGSTVYERHIEKSADGRYQIIKREQLNSPLDSSWGKNPPERTSATTKARDERKAIETMIDVIIAPYLKPSEHSFPVNTKVLKKNLRAKLLN